MSARLLDYSGNQQNMNVRSSLFLSFFLALILIGLSINSAFDILNKKDSVASAWAEVAIQLNRRLELVSDLLITSHKFMPSESEKLALIDEALRNISPIKTELPNEEDLTKIVKAESYLLLTRSDLTKLAASNQKLLQDGGFQNIQDQGDRTENRLIVAKGKFVTAVKVLKDSSASPFGFLPSKILGISPPPTFDSSMPLGPQSPNFVDFSK